MLVVRTLSSEVGALFAPKFASVCVCVCGMCGCAGVCVCVCGMCGCAAVCGLCGCSCDSCDIGCTCFWRLCNVFLLFWPSLVVKSYSFSIRMIRILIMNEVGVVGLVVEVVVVHHLVANVVILKQRVI